MEYAQPGWGHLPVSEKRSWQASLVPTLSPVHTHATWREEIPQKKINVVNKEEMNVKEVKTTDDPCPTALHSPNAHRHIPKDLTASLVPLPVASE